MVHVRRGVLLVRVERHGDDEHRRVNHCSGSACDLIVNVAHQKSCATAVGERPHGPLAVEHLLEACEAKAADIVKIGDFVPKEPYTPIEKEELGDVVFPTQTVFIGALFSLDKNPCCVDPDACSTACTAGYPLFACPLDTGDSSDGSNSFMMPIYQDEDTGDLILKGTPFKDKESNDGVVPFRIRVQETKDSLP